LRRTASGREGEKKEEVMMDGWMYEVVAWGM